MRAGGEWERAENESGRGMGAGGEWERAENDSGRGMGAGGCIHRLILPLLEI